MTAFANNRILLGSASPRRLELLSLLVDCGRIDVIAPRCDELPLDQLMTSGEVDDGLRENVRLKRNAVTAPHGFALFADTVVVVPESGSRFRCLGKPPAQDWEPVVDAWFRKYYVAGPHWVRTGFTLVAPGRQPITEIVETELQFRHDACGLLPWYLSTQESIGKAGGYGLQGAGSLFATRVSGSLSNVIGLPLERIHDALTRSGFSSR